MTSSSAALAPTAAVYPRGRESVRCMQCSLPVRGAGVRLAIDGVTQPFCCYGCYVVLRFTHEPGAGGQAQGLFLRLGLALFFSMNAMMFSLPGYFPYVYGGEQGDAGFLLLLRVGALVLTVPVLVLLGLPVAWQALRDASQWTVSTDALIALGTFVAFGVSVANTIHGAEHVYFDTIAMLLVLVAIGRYLEARGKADTGEILKRLTASQSGCVRVEREGEAMAIDAADVRVGDIVCLHPGDACPIDGILVHGQAHFGEATLTGESRPERKCEGAEVLAGSINLDGDLRVRAVHVGAGSTLGRLHHLVEDALAERSGLQRLADRMASVFMPVVLGLAALTFTYWWLHDGSDRAVLAALSVLVVACPCAFGIATPAAVWIGIGEAGRRGMLLKSADVLETLARVDTVWFDKTGTLTTGRMSFEGMTRAPGLLESEVDLLAIARGLESAIPHPIAVALSTGAGAALPVVDLRYHAGLGVEGRLEDRRWWLGSQAFLMQQGAHDEAWVEQSLHAAAQSGAVAVLLGCAGGETGGVVQAVLRFSDPLRDDAARMLEEMRGLGLQVGVLSGGTTPLPSAWLAATPLHTGLLPTEKAAWITRTRQRGVVAMIGDGLNDAPAFATADVGIALGTGRDLLREAANVSIISTDLSALPWLIRWSRRVRRTVLQNLAWASGYNAIAIVAAMAGWLNPVLAAVVMILSSVMIIANARRLHSFS